MQVTSLMIAINSVLNFFCLTFALWLGFFIVTRSPRSKVSWLGGAALWAISASFLAHLVLLHSSALEAREIWWWGWSVALAVSFLYHMSVALLPDRRAVKRQGSITLIYLLALNLIAMQAYTPWIFERGMQQGASESGFLTTGPLYPLFAAFLIVMPVLSLGNLRLGLLFAKSKPVRQRFKVLIWASGFALCGALWGGLMTWLAPEVGGIVSDLCIGIAVVLLGYGVVRWNALVEGRSVRFDFLYTSISFGFVIGVYLLAVWLSMLFFNVSFMTFLLLIVLVVITHSLYDRGRYPLNRWILGDRWSRKLKESLRDFLDSIPSNKDLHDRLQVPFQTLCRNLMASHGFIALYEGKRLVPASKVKIRNEIETGDAQVIMEDDIQRLSPPQEFLGVSEIAIVVPLHFGANVLGILALGKRQDGTRYCEADLTLLEHFADVVAAVVHAVELQKNNVEQIESLTGEVHRLEHQLQQQMYEEMGYDAEPLRWLAQDEAESVAQVEDALRHLHDYSYLGSQQLAGLQIVDSCLTPDEATVTHVDRGKALKRALVGAIEKLMPAAERMPSPPSREWHPYVILHDCYVLGKPNRDVMAELYISEGTFNRTRRRALRSAMRVLAEMERDAIRSTEVE